MAQNTVTIQQQFIENPTRADDRRLSAAGVTIDYSRHWATDQDLQMSMKTLAQRGFSAAREALFSGGLVNTTEHRAALHMAVRASSHSQMARDLPETMRDVLTERKRCFDLASRIRAGTYPGQRQVTDIVNVGIGGSDLGPRLLVESVSGRDNTQIKYHAISNVDPTAWSRLKLELKPETTLVVLASKSFRTQETLENGKLILSWLTEALDDAAMDHVFAVTASPDNAKKFGLKATQILPIWDWIGGRFSVWSAVGFAALCAIGEEKFQRFLNGAESMDTHFRSAPPEQNIPVIMACLSDYYRNEHGLQSQAIIPYAEALQYLPAYLQQLEMESLGKCVDVNGHPIVGGTSQILWGQSGTNGQHAFHQLLHQGSVISPVDLILVKQGPQGYEAQHNMLLANGLAQAEALAFGRKHNDPHRDIPGNKPNSIIGLEQLTPEALGALIAAYEHKVFTLGLMWNINPFDQFGVELGKDLCTQFLEYLNDPTAIPPQSIATWIKWCQP